VLILRDVLGYRADEVADMLDSTTESVHSALKRARAGLERRLPNGHEPAPAPGSATEQALIDKFVRAYAAGDVDGLVALFAEDVRVSMPPITLEYEGREVAADFFAAIMKEGWSLALVPTRANGQPALAAYADESGTGVNEAYGVMVFSLRGDRISAITGFPRRPDLFTRLGLATTHPD
jgi:hypothetical protein